jgi:RNA polymerase sigma-70 factor (ECF subfamily)
MSAADELAAAFEAQRAYLRRIAYSTLGSFADADDVVQETWLRLQRTEPEQILNLKAWLTTTVGRLALNTLGSAHRRREQYVGPWLPEPLIVTDPDTDPADRVTLDEDVTMALLVVLERLSPAERTAFVLHDVFAISFEQVGEIVGRRPAAVRQLAARARQHVTDGTPRFPASRDEHRRIVSAFTAAAQAGDLQALVALLDPAVTYRADGGGKTPAPRRPVVGADRVARLITGLVARAPSFIEWHPVLVNHTPGIILTHGSHVRQVLSFTIDQQRIVSIDSVRNPDKLRHLQPDVPRDPIDTAR